MEVGCLVHIRSRASGFPRVCVFVGCNFLPPLGFKDNQHWNHLIQDAQRRGAIIKTCDKNYKQDATKILKLKSVLQRSLTHPPSAAPEGLSPQGSELARTLLADAPFQASVDAQEAAVSGAGKDPERPPGKDQLRDPRLLKRMGISAEAPGSCLRNPEPWGPPHAVAAAPSGEPSFPGPPQALGPALELGTATGSSYRPYAPWELPAAGVDFASKSDQKGGHSHPRDTRAFSDRDQEVLSPVSHHPKRSSSWNDWRAQEERPGWKRRRL